MPGWRTCREGDLDEICELSCTPRRRCETRRAYRRLRVRNLSSTEARARCYRRYPCDLRGRGSSRGRDAAPAYFNSRRFERRCSSATGRLPLIETCRRSFLVSTSTRRRRTKRVQQCLRRADRRRRRRRRRGRPGHRSRRQPRVPHGKARTGPADGAPLAGEPADGEAHPAALGGLPARNQSRWIDPPAGRPDQAGRSRRQRRALSPWPHRRSEPRHDPSAQLVCRVRTLRSTSFGSARALAAGARFVAHGVLEAAVEVIHVAAGEDCPELDGRGLGRAGDMEEAEAVLPRFVVHGGVVGRDRVRREVVEDPGRDWREADSASHQSQRAEVIPLFRLARRRRGWEAGKNLVRDRGRIARLPSAAAPAQRRRVPSRGSRRPALAASRSAPSRSLAARIRAHRAIGAGHAPGRGRVPRLRPADRLRRARRGSALPPIPPHLDPAAGSRSAAPRTRSARLRHKAREPPPPSGAILRRPSSRATNRRG